MERHKNTPSNVLEPLTPKQLEGNEQALLKLIRYERKRPGNIKFEPLFMSEDVISVCIFGKPHGIWLFDANSQYEIRTQRRHGLKIVENPSDMVLTGQYATIDGINSQLPSFLNKFYPDLVQVLPIERQKILTPQNLLKTPQNQVSVH